MVEKVRCYSESSSAESRLDTAAIAPRPIVSGRQRKTPSQALLHLFRKPLRHPVCVGDLAGAGLSYRLDRAEFPQ